MEIREGWRAACQTCLEPPTRAKTGGRKTLARCLRYSGKERAGILFPTSPPSVRLPFWLLDTAPPGRWNRKGCHRGFTLIELLIVIAIILTLAAIAIPSYLGARDAARIARAVGDIRTLEKEIMTYEVTKGTLPTTLADIGRGDLLDPWGTPYYYWTYADPTYKDVWREDDFLDPLNSSYDLFSAGYDRQWAPHLMESVSRDDIVRANDGAYVGLAWQY